MDNTYCPYCLHRMDKDELTDEGLRDELARRLYPDAEELQRFPGFCSECRRPFPEPESVKPYVDPCCDGCGRPLEEEPKVLQPAKTTTT